MHAPGTLLADQFGGDWEAYLTAIEQSDPLILALGVTDYFCIQTYKEVRKRKAAGRPAHGPEIWCQRPPRRPIFPVLSVFNSLSVNSLGFLDFHGMEEVIHYVTFRPPD